MDAMHVARREGMAVLRDAWQLQPVSLDFLETGWSAKDNGIWEVRGEQRHFTHSKVMCWVAFDRAVMAIERSGLDGPVDGWLALRAQVFDEVLARGFDGERKTFTHSYASRALDASRLLTALVGFLPATDPKMMGTAAAIERGLLDHGFVLRYRTVESIDGLPSAEGAFLPCSLWLVDNYALQGRREEACALLEQLPGLANDLGPLAEEYDPRAGRRIGNLPQAFSQVALINAARSLAGVGGKCIVTGDG